MISTTMTHLKKVMGEWKDGRSWLYITLTLDLNLEVVKILRTIKKHVLKRRA